MTDGNTYAINKHLDEQDDYEAPQEVTTELEQAESRIEELSNCVAVLEAKLSKGEALLVKAVEAERVYCANVVKHFMEAKLAKAVEALADLADCVDDGCFCSEMQMATAMDNARTTLAELKGQDDE